MNVTRADYDAIDAVNWSTAKSLATSPLHYRHALTVPREDTDAMRLGRATHTAVFEPERFLADWVLWTGGARRGHAWESFRAEHGEERILRPDDYATALAIRDAVRSHPVASRYLLSGHAEHTMTWVNPLTGIKCKGRVDWLSDGAVVDLKTTSKGVDRRSFGSTAARSLYHGQLAFYREGVHATTGRDVSAVLVAVESAAPFDVAVYELDDDALYAGEQLVATLMQILARCRATNEWPGVAPTLELLRLPAWATGVEDDDAAFDAALG